MSDLTKEEVPYLSAIVTYLDRDTGERKRAMHYPITQIDLMRFDEILGVQPQKVFVARNGKWEEIQ